MYSRCDGFRFGYGIGESSFLKAHKILFLSLHIFNFLLLLLEIFGQTIKARAKIHFFYFLIEYIYQIIKKYALNNHMIETNIIIFKSTLTYEII